MAEWQPYEPDLDRITVERFSLSERVQHIVLMAATVILIVTGLPLLVPEVGTRVLRGAFSFRTWLHHTAGATLIVLAIYHGFYVAFTESGRRNLGGMVPRARDVRDLLHYLRYQLGKTDAPPAYGRFDPFEKFEYLAVVWGSIVMIGTGLMMWFFEITLRYFPKWVYDLAVLVHGYEAVLAFLAIILGHLYHVHLKPGVFPMSRVWLDGRVTVRELKEHHPEEYEKWLREQRVRHREELAPAREEVRS